MKAIREMSEEDIKDRIQEFRTELLKLRTNAASGTLRKDSGRIRPLRRDIARMKTRLSEMKKR
jgi:large subunit ribosomal protein L29